MMPHESGRMLQLTTAPDWYRWNDTLICNNKDIDYVLVGTTNPAHIDEMLVAAGEMEDPSPVPDMRTIDSGSKTLSRITENVINEHNNRCCRTATKTRNPAK